MVVSHFLRWIDTAKVSERAAAASALARAYINADLPFEDRCAAEAALTLLLDDPSSKVRFALAEALSMSRHAPIQIVNALASDQPEVAALVLARSPLYLTPPWGVLEQPPFVNAVAKLETALAPHDLLDALLAIERAAGRVRDGERWGPRTLDLDILHVDGVVLDDERVTLPHPRIHERAFVLVPLNDLAPGLQLPGQGRVADLLAALDATGLERLP